MLQKLDNNEIFQEILKDRQSNESKLNAVLVHLSNNKLTALSVFAKMDISSTTRKQYKHSIIRFLSYIRHNPHKIDMNALFNYKEHLNKLELSISTKKQCLVVAKIFLKELARQGLIQDITLNVKSFKQSVGHKKFGHKEHHIKKMIDFFNSSENTRETSRLSAIFHLACMHGLRQIEIARLDYNDMDFSSGSINILGKGRDDKERVYISEKTMRVLKTYIEKWKISTGPLLFSTSNRSKGIRLSTRSIQRLYNKIVKLTGIPGKEVSMHGFRHFFTTELIRKNVPLNTVQKFTRHKSLNMLQVYNDEVWMSDESKKIHDDVFSKYAK